MEKLYIKNTDSIRPYLQRKSDLAFIPADPDNIDYREFLNLCEQFGENEIVEIISE